jgi:hypothetical protein
MCVKWTFESDGSMHKKHIGVIGPTLHPASRSRWQYSEGEHRARGEQKREYPWDRIKRRNAMGGLAERATVNQSLAS